MGVRVGMLYPGSSAEDEYPRMERILGDGVDLPVVITSVGVDAHEVDALLDLGRSERLLTGARTLVDDAARPDAVMWACTSGSFVFGWDGAHRQSAEIADDLGVPAGSTSIAFVAACRELGLEKVAVAATYPYDVSRHFVDFLAHGDVGVTELVSHDIPTAELAGELGHDEVLHLARSNDSPAAQAILIPDTALHTVAWIDELETLLEKPVLTANQVTAWYGLRLAGARVTNPDLGSLFRR